MWLAASSLMLSKAAKARTGEGLWRVVIRCELHEALTCSLYPIITLQVFNALQLLGLYTRGVQVLLAAHQVELSSCPQTLA